MIQSNLYNPTLHGTAKLCWITEVVKLSSYLHNPTLASMSGYSETITHNIFSNVFDNKQ